MGESNREEGRIYQVALCELAIKENCIICLPTGCGKTYIALSVAKLEYLPKAIAEKKKIIFLANSIPLVHQQASYFRKHISSSGYGETSYSKNAHVKPITGDMNTDNWNKEIWDKVMENTEILVMTPEILKIALNHNRITFDQINLLILDECHHATKSHPMAVIMENYNDIRKSYPDYRLPRVIGLTATIIMGTSKRDKIPEEVVSIERRLHSRAVTYPEYTEVLRYSTSAEIKIIEYVGIPRGAELLINTELSVINLLESYIQGIKSVSKTIKDSRKDTVEHINHPSLRSAEQMYNKNKMSADDIERALKDVKKIFENEDVLRNNLLVPIGLGLYPGRLAAVLKLAFLKAMSNEEKSIDGLRARSEEALSEVIAYCDSILIEDAKSKQIRNFVSSKVEKLFTMLLEWQKSFGATENLCGIVFCKERLTAQILSWLFLDASKNCEEFQFIKPSFVIGSGGANNDLEEQKINAVKQNESIKKFHDKEVNLIFATNVLEEGLDVPACNIVIRFDPVDTYPSFVQSMGRARKKGAKFLAMTSAKDLEKTKLKMQNFQAYSHSLADFLIQNKRDVLNVTDDQEDAGEEDQTSFCIDPTNPNSPKITLTESVQLVYRYCQLLSTDRIVSLEPNSWWQEVGVRNNKPLFKAFVALPINAVIREVIEGKPAENKNMAKRYAFLETCVRLYCEGAFDESLFPLRRAIPKEITTFLDDMEGSEKYRNDKKIGTKNSTMWYKKMIPKVIENNRIVAGDSFNAYWIKLVLLKSTTESVDREKLYSFNGYQHGFAILTKIDLTDVPYMCLYGRHGILSCTFERIKLKREIILSADEISEIEKFQRYIFRECLNISHPLMSNSDENPLFIAGLCRDKDNDWAINWDLFKKLDGIDKSIYKVWKDDNERRKQRYTPEDLEDAVVVPWYRPDEGLHFYCVCRTRTDLSPSSPMDDNKPDSKTFEVHYANKYNLKILNGDQPFVRCASLGTQLNFLTKKRDENIMSKVDRKMQHDSSGVVDLIPEFVRIYPIPASLLVQARFLPSVLHRTYRLLLSRQIHLEVAQKFQWKAALAWKAQDASIDFFDRECPSPPKIAKREEPELEEGELPNSDPEEAPPKPKIVEKSIKVRSKLKIVHLDYIHPDEITPNEINQHRLWKSKEERKQLKKASILSNLFSDLPCNIMPLIDMDDITMESMDAPTNFDKTAGPSPLDIMESLTLSNANDILSLENLELIGDSFLKYYVSTHIFCEFPTFDEGQLTKLRNQLVSNCHLFKFGSERQIGEMLGGGIFVPTTSWVPPGQKVPLAAGEAAAICDTNYEIFDLPESQAASMSAEDLVTWIKENKTVEDLHKKTRAPANSTFTHTRLGDKSIADSVEALIGTYYTKGGQDGALAFMEWLGLRAPDVNGQKVNYRRRTPPKCEKIYEGTRKPEDFLPLLSDLEDLIDYRFNNKWLVVEAFSHPGFLRNSITGCYQRLEFIGDAVLDFLVTNHIYKNGLRKDPGELTDLRSALVNNVTFGSLAVRYKLHNYLLIICKKLQDAIDKFETYQKQNKHAVTGHFTLMNDVETPMAMEIEVPKVLGDIFESLAGSVFLDCNMSLDKTWKVFYRLMKNEIDEFTKNTPISPVRELYERFPELKFVMVDENEKTERKGMTNVSVKLKGKVYLGTGTNKKQAKQAVAKYALMRLKLAEGKIVANEETKNMSLHNSP